jgi:hypothetical protein
VLSHEDLLAAIYRASQIYCVVRNVAVLASLCDTPMVLDHSMFYLEPSKHPGVSVGSSVPMRRPSSVAAAAVTPDAATSVGAASSLFLTCNLSHANTPLGAAAHSTDFAIEIRGEHLLILEVSPKAGKATVKLVAGLQRVQSATVDSADPNLLHLALRKHVVARQCVAARSWRSPSSDEHGPDAAMDWSFSFGTSKACQWACQSLLAAVDAVLQRKSAALQAGLDIESHHRNFQQEDV